MLMQAIAILGVSASLVGLLFAAYCLYKWQTEWRHW